MAHESDNDVRNKASGDGHEGRRRRKGTGVRLWGALSAVSAVLMIAVLVGTPIAQSYATVINLYLDTPTTAVKKGEDSGDTEYFKSAFDSKEDMVSEAGRVSRQVEAEGATLLLNRDGALPLQEGAKVSTFSHSSVDLIYGGTGSGSMDASSAPTLREALEESGLEVNGTLWDFYSSDEITEGYSRKIPTNIAGMAALKGEGERSTDYASNEVPWEMVDEAAGDTFAEYGDAAIFVLSRSGGEGADLPDGTSEEDVVQSSTALDGDYLVLSEEEKATLAGLKQRKDSGDIKRIVVLVNSSNAPQCDFLFPEVCGVDYGIDAALWCGGVGQTGVFAVADILAGRVNPSGSLVDTFLVDNATNPANANFYATEYANAEELGMPTRQVAETGFSPEGTYVLYQEGIYVGYRYHETRYEDVVMGSGNAGGYDYGSAVAFPFGHGLSYTTFLLGDFSAIYDASSDEFELSVAVTNTGDVAGKKTVQAYLQSPYTDYDRENGVEKASVELVGYAKTGLLQPGESQTLTIPVAREELRAYDANGARGYILDAGTYRLTVADDAHAAVNNMLASKGYSPQSTGGAMDAEGDSSMVWTWDNAELDTASFATSSATGETITNLFDSGDPNKNETSDNVVTWLSRSDWEGTYPDPDMRLSATEAMAQACADSLYDEGANPNTAADATMPTLGAEGDMTLAQMIGKDYDDPAWGDLLDQVTFDEMVSLISLGFHTTAEVPSVSKTATRDENGPQGLTASLIGGGNGMFYPSCDIMAATFNDELIEDMGELIGEDCLYGGYSGLYGPALNIHRTAYAGRNFEYYSEDPFISGEIGAASVKGIQSKGVYVYLKHFALNDQETNRRGICTWINEQALREVYLQAFEYPIVEAGAAGVMNSFSRLGTTWTGASYEMQTALLRDEWGMTGIDITDFSGLFAYMDVADGLLAGSNLWDSSQTQIHTTKLATYEDDPQIVSAMRESTHRILYTVANSNAMNGMGPNDRIVSVTPWWQTALYALCAVFVATTVACVIMLVRRVRRLRAAKAAKR